MQSDQPPARLEIGTTRFSQNIEFDELRALQKRLEVLRSTQVSSLKEYYRSEKPRGFRHRHDERKDRPSTASTATCVLSLIATDRWAGEEWGEHSEEIAAYLLKKEWKSAGLESNNPFTVSFILEAATALAPCGTEDSEADQRAEDAEKILLEALDGGCVGIDPYPESAYLTQLTARVLLERDALPDEQRTEIDKWAWSEIYRQLSLRAADNRRFDPYQLAYCVILVSSVGTLNEATPDQTSVLDRALREVFTAQRPDGSWPLSQPLFHYPEVGNAHCYEYEMLVQLLGQPELELRLLAYLPALTKTAEALDETAYELGTDGARGWSSGHHPQFQKPESWSTASVYHFAHSLDRLLAEAIRRWLFDHLNVGYHPPRSYISEEEEFASQFLDCPVHISGMDKSLTGTLYRCFVDPIVRNVGNVKSGKSLPDDVSVSAIFFGPPGTSKTELTKIISEALGWPRLTVDPSYFVRHGMQRVLAEASRLFHMLASAEQIVVLFDEFDEMVREREGEEDPLSRFLTTAMLPKLAEIRERRRLVFIVATNHIDAFDVAIRRPGRFDLLLQVLPPTADAKRGKWPILAEKLGTEGSSELLDEIADLTYLECKTLVQRLKTVPEDDAARALVKEALEQCTLNSSVANDDEATWKRRCEDQKDRTRLPYGCDPEEVG